MIRLNSTLAVTMEALAEGIYAALVTTLVGLIVAIPAAIAHIILKAKSSVSFID